MSEPTEIPSRVPSGRPGEDDDLDRRILALVIEDARMSVRAIARELGVAPGTIAERLRRHESSGVIRKYSAVVDPSALGKNLAFVVALQITQGHSLDTVMEYLMAMPEIERVLVVTGRWDLIVLGRASGMDEFNRLLTQGLWHMPMFRHSETMLVVDERTPGMSPVTT